MRQKITKAWQSLAIRNKIAWFTGGVLLIIFLSCIVVAWIARFSIVDFSNILRDNTKNGELVRTMEKEVQAFADCVNNPDDEKQRVLEAAMKETKAAVEDLPFDYNVMGKELYAKTWSVRNSYEVYEGKRDEILAMDEDEAAFISGLYEVYDMQGYLLNYTRELMIESVEAGNVTYREKYAWTVNVPAAAIGVLLVLFLVVIWLAKTMNGSIIYPVMELAEASRKIASNDFYIEDIQVENKDELGELVAAFNKMKYATGRYIQTQEEKRIALDRLHEKEVERLEMERRLESAQMELLKSQINPHFLFNTLNVIGGMANLEEADITEKMIKALSDLFRYNLKNDQPVVSLTRELKVVRDYMYLQHMRFGARISYEIDCNVDTEKVMIPTFTFQPLVENAIIHGLTPKVEGGKIRICVRERQKNLFISVYDNGVGMSEETLQKVKNELSESIDQRAGIGISNVSGRIHCMYPDSKVEVYSRQDRGTLVQIQIPMKGM
ncbi:MAG: histidine kinase [Eubacteriales bacterium]|nr:histidine kinase [Eubacteriales bacterium]